MTPDDIARILEWPPETWSDSEIRQVQEYRTDLHHRLFTLAEEAERENRNLTPGEAERYAAMQAEFDRLGDGIPAQR
jgi:hypothetical protein